jgi:hypothetical protein
VGIEPKEFVRDPLRDAKASIRGYVYQVDMSILRCFLGNRFVAAISDSLSMNLRYVWSPPESTWYGQEWIWRL